MRSRLIDHERRDGIRGLVTALPAKSTTARSFAQNVVDHAFKKLGQRIAPCRTSSTPVAGGDIEDLASYTGAAKSSYAGAIDARGVGRLVRAYGTRWEGIAALASEEPALAKPLAGGQPVIGAEVVEAVRREWAKKLSDVIFRRTGLGTIGHPGRECLTAAAELMRAELGWSEQRCATEIREVEERLAIAPHRDAG
jgi:glycerol-3-phosphate dehydrogenase